MVTRVELKGFKEFDQFVQTIDPKGPPVLLYFSGSKTSEGKSWCPDCVDAEPVVDTFLSQLIQDVIFAYIEVGDIVTWRHRECPFRTDSHTKLMVIPTIIRWNGVKRLEGSQCKNQDLLQMLLEDED